MLAILFPHMYEDIEYLIPGEVRGDDASMGSLGGTTTGASMHSSGIARGIRPRQENAVAGPSRLC